MIKKTLAIWALVLCIFACGEPVEPMMEQSISDDFVLEQKWNFTLIEGDGVIFGVPRSDVDEMPMGYVEFMANGKGYADFSTELLGLPFLLQDSIVWTRPAQDTVILQAVTEGKVDTWNILNATQDSVRAKWDINIAGNTATLIADLIVD